MRYGLAAVVLAPFVLRRGLRWPAGMRQWGAIVLTGFLIQCIYVSLACLAMKRGMDAGTAVIIMALQPILVGALLPLLGARSSGAWLWPGLGLGFAGVVVAILPGTTLGPGPLVAVLFAVAALLGITAATLFEKWHGFRTDPAVGGMVQYVVGLAVLMPLAAMTESLAVDWHPDLVVALAHLVIANSVISIGLVIARLQRGDATRTSSLLCLVPPLAMCLAWVIPGENLTTGARVGFTLSAAGVYIMNRQTA